MDKTHANDFAKKVIGSGPLYGLRDRMKVRLFAVHDGQIQEVTRSVVVLCGFRTTRDNKWISIRGGGFCPVDAVVDEYNRVSGSNVKSVVL